jgi:toxin CcdB
MQCEVHANTEDDGAHIPYLIDVQTDLLSELDTRVVVPLVRSTSLGRPVSRLHPVFTVEGQRVVMATHLVAAVRRGVLGASVASLSDQRDVIIGAIDVLWSGV